MSIRKQKVAYLNHINSLDGVSVSIYGIKQSVDAQETTNLYKFVKLASKCISSKTETSKQLYP